MGSIAKHPAVSTFLNQLGGLVIAGVALALIWDLAGRRSFLDETLEVLRIKNDIVAAGLEAIGTDYGKSIDWDERLKSAKQLDVFAAWAATWRNTHQTKLMQMASRSGAKIRVCLPDSADSSCVRFLASRFNMTSTQVKAKLNEAVDGYKALDGRAATGRVEIYTSTVVRAFTAYRVDDHFIVTLYHHKDSRSGSVPAMTCHRGGSLFEFFEDDLEGVLNAGTKIYP
ncbi:hypothetical protein VM98_07720 [Streptomyces rubellomurinus subsp. indigoferus]|nr:hypothetical protein VM98_07720 [Streptomyces rubellomurinus subsp. indigoferus]